MARQTRRRVFGWGPWLGAALAAGLILATGTLAVQELRALGTAFRQVRETFDLLDSIERVHAALLDAETGQRGYLLTGDESYLGPYRVGAAAAEGEMATLALRAAAVADTTPLLDEIRGTVQAKLRELETTVELRRRDGLQAALAVVQTEFGLRTMDRARALLAQLREQEEERLTARVHEREERSRGVLAATLSLVGVSLLTFAAILASLYHAMRTRIAARNAAVESEQRLRVTLSSIGDAVIATDLSGHVVFTNPVAQALTGWREDDARGLPLDQVFRIVHEFSRDVVESPVSKVLRDGAIVGLANHTVLIARDGTERPIDDSGAPIRDASGEMMGVVLVFRDVSARRLSEQARERLVRSEAERDAAESANRAKDEFLAVVSHELRTPLGAAVSWLDLLRSGTLAGEPAARALTTIERNLRQQARLIDDLLDVSRIVSGKLVVERVPVDLGALVRAAVEDARDDAAARGIALALGAIPGPAVVSADAGRVAQVLANLISNALKFTPAGGAVRVLLRHDEDVTAIEVRDTGHGIAPAFLPHVFDRFRQAESARGRGQQGLGLGLAIARHLIELHGGAITAESEGLGRGASFRVSLPTLAAAAPDPVRGRVEDRRDALAGVRVLLVEDHDDSRAALAHLLRTRGATVQEAASAAEALAAFDAAQPAIVVSDIGMPDEDGLRLIERLRQREVGRGRTPAIATTGFASVQDRHEALAAGYDEHVPKPVQLAELVAKMRALLGPAPSP